MSRCDVIVIGAGIHGCGVAQGAAAAGHSVLLLEQQFPAHGTSSRSSKLIHGGLRYLESGQFHLVAESLAERSYMLANAPELVQLKPFYVPLYKDTRRRAWQLTVGLSLYAVLGRFGRGTSFGFVPRRQWDALDGLKTEGLRYVFRYYDGQTDDAALTRAVLRSAQSLGAQYEQGAQVYATELTDRGVRVSYRYHGKVVDAEATVVVNATGPWAATVARFVTPALQLPTIELVQGTHIQVPGQLRQGIYYVESPRDGRAVFIMPWHDRTLVGTTETRYRGNPEQVHPLPSELNYLLYVLRHYFPAYEGMSARDLLGSFAGLRVLPAGSGHAFHRPRETVVYADRELRPRFVSVLGGKLTGWRATSEQVMKRIAASLPMRPARADTRKLRLEPG